jgi:hypothetical protein
MLAHVPAAFTAHFGQAPMLLLMIVYTVYGLWLLSTPVVG